MIVNRKLSAVLKVFEIVVLLAGTGIVAYFVKEWHDFLKETNPQTDPYDAGALGRFEFYLFATAVGLVVAIFGLVVSLTNIFEKNGGALAMAAVNSLLTLQLLVSAALLALVLVTYKKKHDTIFYGNVSQCGLLKQLDASYNCDQIMGGVVCGFFGALLYFMDAVNAFVASRRFANK